MSDAPEKRLHLVSLGCAKALVDSEVVTAQLQRRGWTLTNEAEAELYLINTCGFIEAALDETYGEIDRLTELRRANPDSRLVVVGCAVDAEGDELLERFPEIDLLAGSGSLARLGALIDNLVESPTKGTQRYHDAPGGAYDGNPDPLPERVALTPAHLAYLKISEGCDLGCAFCRIPALRGPQRSRPVEAVVDEAVSLAAGGVREIILVAQETTAYGRDLYGEPRLAALLDELALNLPAEDLWLRVLYPNPARIDDAFLEALAVHPQLVPYLDLPFQHADHEVLAAMRRPGGPDELLRTIERARELIPDLVLRGTALVGFPAESPLAFENLVDFIEAVRFDHLGVFTYSAMPDTPAWELGDPVEDDEKEVRAEALHGLQEAISLQHNSALVGKTRRVLVDAVAESDALARGVRHCPEVDGLIGVSLPPGHDWRPGEFRDVVITNAQPYDLSARPADDPGARSR
jgi:ribosomal protein S12 methylthiotransferase